MKLDPQCLSVEEMERLLAAPRKDRVEECRDKALMTSLYWGALRGKEAVNLRLSDVKLAGGKTRVRDEKFNCDRNVFFSEACIKILSGYLKNTRPSLTKNHDSGFFFTTESGELMNLSRIKAAIQRYARRAGIKRRVNLHTFRHSLVAHMRGME